MDPHARTRPLAYAGLVLTTLFWAGNAVVARGVAEEIRPFALAFWRWTTALILILPIGLPHVGRSRHAVLERSGPLFVFGLLSVGAYNTLLYFAAHTTTAINITLVNSTMPIAIAVLAHFVLGERTTGRQVAGFAAAAIGMLAIVARGEWQVLTDFAFRQGDVIMIVAVLLWGGYSVLLRHWPVDIHPLGFLTVTIAVGVAVLLPFFLWEAATHGHFGWRPGYPALFGFLGIFPSILAFLFWNHGVAVVGPNTTAMFIYLVPVFTALLAYPILGEALQPYHAAGGILILAGLYLATRTG